MGVLEQKRVFRMAKEAGAWATKKFLALASATLEATDRLIQALENRETAAGMMVEIEAVVEVQLAELALRQRMAELLPATFSTAIPIDGLTGWLGFREHHDRLRQGLEAWGPRFDRGQKQVLSWLRRYRSELELVVGSNTDNGTDGAWPSEDLAKWLAACIGEISEFTGVLTRIGLRAEITLGLTVVYHSIRLREVLAEIAEVLSEGYTPAPWLQSLEKAGWGVTHGLDELEAAVAVASSREDLARSWSRLNRNLLDAITKYRDLLKEASSR